MASPQLAQPPPASSSKQPAPQAAGTSRTNILRLRPHTIAELARFATLDNPYDVQKPLKHWLRVGARMRDGARNFETNRDLENAFVQYARAATLILERLPNHPEFQTLLDIEKRRNLALNGQDILTALSRLKKPLVEKYEKWAKANPDLVNEKGQPLIPTSHVPPEQVDTAARREARERYGTLQSPPLVNTNDPHAEEEDQQRLHQYQEEQRRREQRRLEEELQYHHQSASGTATPTQSRMDTREDDMTAAPEGPELETQEDVHRRRQEEHQRRQQEAMKRREAEIKRRKAEEQRRAEQAGIQRRQLEADRMAAEARRNQNVIENVFGPILSQPQPAQGLGQAPLMPQPQSDAPSSAMANMGISSTAAPPPLIPQAPITYPVPPAAANTDQHSRERTAIAQRQADADAAANAARQRVPMVSPSAVSARNSQPAALPSNFMYGLTPAPTPPGTAPRPKPIEPGQRIRYPTLMSPHQQKQGFMPSLNSIFLPPDSTTQTPASSMLLGSSNGTPTSNLYNIGLPATSQSYNGDQPQPPPPPAADARILAAQAPSAETTHDLKSVFISKSTLPRFLSIASINTSRNRETCGLLLGKDRGGYYAVSTLLIPRQSATSDTCTMEDEELVLMFTEERSLITLGWIHTHPSQSCFMSSLDLHTHAGFQRMLPESFAIVCAPKHNPDFGVFRLTDPPGLSSILQCNAKEAFHPHPDLPIYTDADRGHVQLRDGMPLEIVDLR